MTDHTTTVTDYDGDTVSQHVDLPTTRDYPTPESLPEPPEVTPETVDQWRITDHTVATPPHNAQSDPKVAVFWATVLQAADKTPGMKISSEGITQPRTEEEIQQIVADENRSNLHCKKMYWRLINGTGNNYEIYAANKYAESVGLPKIPTPASK